MKSLRVIKRETVETGALTCFCCGREITKVNTLENGERVGDECASLIETPVYRFGRKLSKKQAVFFACHGLEMPERKQIGVSA